MGNHPSVSEEVASSLSPSAKKKLQTFIEIANKTSAAPRSMPSLRGTWHETSRPTHRGTAIVIKQRSQPPPPPPVGARGDSTGRSSVTTKMTVVTERRPSGNPNTPYYVVSTTTYYVQAPESPVLSIGSSSNSEAGANESSPMKNKTLGTETYTTINKRKFVCIPGMQYGFMCDDDESDRLIVQHFLLKYAFCGNFIAPIQEILVNETLCNEEDPRPQVLDIGCGPGTWVLEMATEFTGTDFHGIDACPTFPNTIKPPNAHFCQHNVLRGLPYDDATFDYVHVRLLLSNMTHAQALGLIEQVTRVLKPNGYVELCDAQYRVVRPGPVTDAHVNQKLHDVFKSSYQVNLDSSHHLSTNLIMTGNKPSSGYVDIYQEQTTLPLGWGGQLGQLHGQNFHAFLCSLDPYIREKAELTDKVIDQIVQECEKHQSHLHWFACYGRKPSKHDSSSPPSSPSSIGTEQLLMQLPPSPIDESAWESIAEFANGYVD